MRKSLHPLLRTFPSKKNLYEYSSQMFSSSTFSQVMIRILFLLNLEQFLAYLNSIKLDMLLVTGDFNVRSSSSWWSDDIDTIEGKGREGTRLESITSYYEFIRS